MRGHPQAPSKWRATSPDFRALCTLQSTSARKRGEVKTEARLLPLPVRLALVEEGIHALAKILAHIGLEDEILPLVPRQRLAQATDSFLGDFEGDWRMACHQLRQFQRAALQRLHIGHDLVDQ